jgi:acyl dehydratase
MNPETTNDLQLLQVGHIHRAEFLFTQSQVEAFATISGDFNPLHLDETYAATTPFKKPIIHGFLCGSILSREFAMNCPGEGSIYVKQDMQFKRPMFVDNTYEVVLTITSVDRIKHTAVFTAEILDKTTGKPCLTGEAIIMNTVRI